MSELRSAFSRAAIQKRRRAVVKTVLYRLLMIVVTMAAALAVTGDVSTAVNVGILANVVKTGTYYAYERLWAHVTWGQPAGSGGARG